MKQKRLFAMLLVFSLVLGLAACGKPAPKDPTDPTAAPTTTPTTVPTTAPTVSAPYQGKKLQIWGFGDQDAYTNYENYGNDDYLYMMRAAMEEWAAINGVTLEFKGSYKVNALLSEMVKGGKPDVIFSENSFPVTAEYGVASAFKAEEYQYLADICGKQYLDSDLLNYQHYFDATDTSDPESYGVLLPWSASVMCSYNKSMFERYQLKTPMEYYQEGNWTWETFETCMQQLTRDVDRDGDHDTYGLDIASFDNLVYAFQMSDKGDLQSVLNEPWLVDFAQLKYHAVTVNKTACAANGGKIQQNTAYPMWGMQLDVCYSYDVESFCQKIPNGDVIEVVPVPAWAEAGVQKKYATKYNQYVASLCAATDERDAAMDMLGYVLRCGLKYMADCSGGAIPCDYAGIQGACAVSQQWKDAFADAKAVRAAKCGQLTESQKTHIKQLNDYIKSNSIYSFSTRSAELDPTRYEELATMPPESSLAAIKEQYEKALAKHQHW